MANKTINELTRGNATNNSGLPYQDGTSTTGVTHSINIETGSRHNESIPTVGKVDDLIGLNVLHANSESDFPTQDATTITIADNTIVKLGASITTSKSFIVGKDVVIDGGSSGLLNRLIYTGIGIVLSGANVDNFTIMNTGIEASSASEVFNFTDTTRESTFICNTLALYASDSGSVCANKFGTFDNLNIVNINTVNTLSTNSGLGVNDGITISNGVNILSMYRVNLGSIVSPTYIGLDLGTSVIDSFASIEDFVNVGIAVGSVGISGLTGSANLGSTVQGRISGCAFSGAVTPLVGIDREDTQWEVTDSYPVENSVKDAFIYMDTEQTVPVSTVGEFYPIAGVNWVEARLSRFTTDSEGILTYIGMLPADVKIEGSLSVTKVGGGSNEICAGISIDTGSGFPTTPPERTQDCTQSPDPTSVTPMDLVKINNGDRIQIWVANNSSTSNIVVAKNAKLMIVNGF